MQLWDSIRPEYDIVSACEDVQARLPPMMIPIADYFEQT